MISPFHVEFLMGPHVFWLASTNYLLVPDTLRSNGVIAENENTLCCFFDGALAAQFNKNMSENKQLSLLAMDLLTFVGYQYKGQVIDITPCTEEHIAIQNTYIDKLTDVLAQIGHPKEQALKMYSIQNTYVARVRVEKIFEQSPSVGTGKEVYL